MNATSMNLHGLTAPLLGLCASFLLPGTESGHAAESNRGPNILFIIADDLNLAIGPYGDPVAHTPNLNRLARRGLVFQRAYCQQAVCNPSRASFLTGLRPHTLGVDDLRKHFRDATPAGSSLTTLPEHFKNHGYFSQGIGKIFHNSASHQDSRSWSMDISFAVGTHAQDTVFHNTPESPESPKPRYKSPVTEAWEVEDTAYRDGQIANLAAGFLATHDSSRQPFFLAVGFWRPHLPFVAPRMYWDLYDADSIPLPEPVEGPEDAPSIALHRNHEILSYGEVPQGRPFTEEETRHFRHGYYASISFMDAQIGKILDALEAGGHADNTIVVFFSDHGFHIGERGLWGKTTNFELDAIVPLIIASPPHAKSHGQKTNAIVELVDLFPTLASLAGLKTEPNQHLEGKDLAVLLEDPSATVKDHAFTWHQQPFYGPASNWQAWGYSVRSDRWRYTEWHSIEDNSIWGRELYDHASDPRETVNVVAHHGETARGLAQVLRKHFGLEGQDFPAPDVTPPVR